MVHCTCNYQVTALIECCGLLLFLNITNYQSCYFYFFLWMIACMPLSKCCSGLYIGWGGADCYDEAKRSDRAWWGHAGVPRGHYRLLSPQGAHPNPVPPHWAAQWAEGREGDIHSYTICSHTFLPVSFMCDFICCAFIQ